MFYHSFISGRHEKLSGIECFHSRGHAASKQIYWNKRKRLHKKGTQLPQDCFGRPTWPPFHCFGTLVWPPWRHVKTLYRTKELANIFPITRFLSFFLSFFIFYFYGGEEYRSFYQGTNGKKKTFTKTFRFSVARLLLKTTAFGYVTIQAEKTNLSLCINNKGKVVIQVRCIHCFLLKKMFL